MGVPRSACARVWAVQLAPAGEPVAEVSELELQDPSRSRLARAGGAALAAVLCERVADESKVPLVLAVGDAVRRGLPTAARLTVASRSPASGTYVDGQLGGSLARRLVGMADAFTLGGRTSVAGAVLVLEGSGRTRIESMPGLIGTAPDAAVKHLRERWPDSGCLVCGPAGEAGFEHASLFNGADPPSSVGRGGLGAVLGRTGLKALVFDLPLAPLDGGGDQLRARLLASPRLLARAEGGSFELIESFAARGEFSGPRGATFEGESVDRLRAGADAGRSGQHGCAGCPTPCGWVFERPGGGRRGGRFSAAAALGPPLGLDDFDAVLRLLEACDRVGVDAKETGEALAILTQARADGLLEGPRLEGDAGALEAEIEALASGGGALRGGAVGVAQRAGLEHALRRSRGQSVRERKSLAALLGQCVSVRGADPMRAFPFLAEDGAERLDAARLALPFALPPGATDPHDPAATGRLVWWHENLSAALDATGFCAFSAGAVLADGVATAEELAAWVLPEAWADAADADDAAGALQSLGAALVLLQRGLNRRWGERGGADLPDWARERLDRPEVYGEYRLLRGLDADGGVVVEAAARIGDRRLAAWGAARLAAQEGGPSPESGLESSPEARKVATPAPGRLRLRGTGALGRLLAELGEDWCLPLSVADLRSELVRRDDRIERWIGAPDEPVASVWRAGSRLREVDLLEDGDVLDLVVAISGG